MFIRVAEEKPQAPKGEYVAKCVHVNPEWSFLGNKKIALYFEITEGEHKHKEARLFYNLERDADGEFKIRPKSKLMKDTKKLFPEKVDEGEYDPNDLFENQFFKITVDEKKTKDGTEKNSIVTTIENTDVGF